MRFSLYALCSTAAVAGLAFQAYQQRRQFYPTVRRAPRDATICFLA